MTGRGASQDLPGAVSSQVEQLRQTILNTLGPLLPDRGRVALLDFPAYGNVGDSAIWLGELACLDDLACATPSYTCDIATYDRRALAARVGGGAILLSGGGNFGDLYERHQLFRERVITDFPHNRIVQLPCSVCFRSRAALERARAAFDAHPRLTLLLRDRRSLEIAGNEFDAAVRLCPDMAFCLGPQRRPRPADFDSLWLCRSDDESRWSTAPALHPSAVDWTAEPRRRWRILRGIGALTAGRFRSETVRRAVSATYPLLARRRVAAGLELLGRARVVVTDRLHGHVFSLLLGIPHVLLPDRYDKNGGFYRTWTHASPNTRWADSPEQAREIAAGIQRELHRPEHSCG